MISAAVSRGMQGVCVAAALRILCHWLNPVSTSQSRAISMPKSTVHPCLVDVCHGPAAHPLWPGNSRQCCSFSGLLHRSQSPPSRPQVQQSRVRVRHSRRHTEQAALTDVGAGCSGQPTPHAVAICAQHCRLNPAAVQGL